MKYNPVGIDEKIRERMITTKSVLSDIDKTGTDTRLANCALKLIGRKMKEGEYAIALSAFLKGAEIMLETPVISKTKGKLYAENRGLQKNFNALVKAGVTEKEYQDILIDFVPKHEMDGYKGLVDELTSFGIPKKLFLTTTGASIGAKVFAEYVGAADYLANPVKVSNGKISGIDIITDSDTKITEMTDDMLSKYNTSVGESIVLNDRYSDTMKHAMVSIAMGPYATKEAREKADLFVSDYTQMTPILKSLR